MKIEVKQVLSDIRFFRDTISRVSFMDGDRGDVVLAIRGDKSVGIEIVMRLATYGIDAKVIKGGATGDKVRFLAYKNSDIIRILNKVTEEQEQQSKGDLFDTLVAASQSAKRNFVTDRQR